MTSYYHKILKLNQSIVRNCNSQISIFLFFITLLLNAGFTKAQDESNCGLLVDGVLVDSLASWNYKELSVVFPTTESLKKFDKITGTLIFRASVNDESLDDKVFCFDLNKSDIADYFSNASYGIWNIFLNGDSASLPFLCHSERGVSKQIERNRLQMFNVKPKDRSWFYEQPNGIVFVLVGSYITGYEEQPSNYGTVLKLPIYGDEKILFSSKIVPFAICFCPYFDPYKKVKDSSKLYSCAECDSYNKKTSNSIGKKFAFVSEKVDYENKFRKIKK